MQRQGHMRDAVRRPAHRCTQSALGDQLQIAQAEQSASSFCFTINNRLFLPRTPKLTFACARALISADAFITSTSHSLFTLRNAPTSGASGFRFDIDTDEAITSTYDPVVSAWSSSNDDDGCCRERYLKKGNLVPAVPVPDPTPRRR